MPGNPIDFAAIIEQDRSERQKLEWQGTFLQYLELVKQRPQLADLAHKRGEPRVCSMGTNGCSLAKPS